MYTGTGDVWFQQDDFAHLKLAAQTKAVELPKVMLRPIAQGTFRPLSERLFYWAGYRMAGLDPMPFRVVAYGALLLSSILFWSIVRQLTGSTLAGVAAATFWAISPCLTLPITWVATANQLLWVSCVLATLAFFIRYSDSGSQRDLWISWAAYLVGFGMLESNVAVALLVTAYAFLFAQHRLLPAILYMLPAGVFTMLHLLLIPRAGGSTYRLTVGPETGKVLWTYWQWSFVLEPWSVPAGFPTWLAPVAGGLFALLVVGLVIYPLTRRVAVFGLVWWMCLLAPVVPLAQHLSDYYLCGPILGIGLLLGAGIRWFPKSGVVIAGLLAVVAIPTVRSYARTNIERSENIEAVVKGVGQVHERNAGKTILLGGVGDGLFWSGVYDHPFSLVGAPETYLTPDAAEGLTPYPDLFRAELYTLPRSAVAAGLSRGEMVVYTVRQRRLVDTTEVYRKRLSGGGAEAFLDFSRVGIAMETGTGWYPQEEGYRWMAEAATVRLSGKGTEVVVSGIRTAAQFEGRDELRVSATWNGVPLGTQVVRKGGNAFQVRFPLAAERADGGELGLRVDPVTTVPGDSRKLGLAVTRIEIR